MDFCRWMVFYRPRPNSRGVQHNVFNLRKQTDLHQRSSSVHEPLRVWRYLTHHIFQAHLLILTGVDLDWEYPQADDRGGQPADTENYVALAKELKAALGQKGLSMTLPTSFWYLQHFDVNSLQEYVDWFNFMSYVSSFPLELRTSILNRPRIFMGYGMPSRSSWAHTLLLTPILPRLIWDWTCSGELMLRPTRWILEWRG